MKSFKFIQSFLYLLGICAGLALSNPDAEAQQNATVTVNIEVTEGKLPFEISWRIMTIDNELIAGGGAPSSRTLQLEYGIYQFIALDSFGDGWNDATYAVTSGGVLLANNDGKSPIGARETEIFVIAPPVETSISRAVSINILTDENFRYQLYRSTDMENWEEVGAPFNGEGKVISVFQHTSRFDNYFYKADVIGLISNANTLNDISVGNLGITMKKIPEGTFLMGSPANENLRDPDEGPQTEVTITKTYWVSSHEVTQSQFETIMSFNPSDFSGSNSPVESVTWEEAMDFCNKLNQRYAEQNIIPEGYHFTLPSEAQWEKACRAGTESIYYFGNSSVPLGDHAWFATNSSNRTHSVGGKLPNPAGLYDIAGNVLEWCLDSWKSSHPGGRVVDYVNITNSSNRVIRGGGFEDGANGCRSAYRKYRSQSGRYNFVGFRIALSPIAPLEP
jgi:formylglycine-generating enzyme required for sulfatase activity